MQLAEREINGISIIDVSDERIGPAENPQVLREKVEALLLRGQSRILFNVANVQHMDSTCLGEIVQTYKITTSNGATLKLAQVGPGLRNLLHTTALDKVLELYDTESEAIASFADTPEAEPARTVLLSSSLWSDK
jgi:anti-sigma B factor antagonist